MSYMSTDFILKNIFERWEEFSGKAMNLTCSRHFEEVDYDPKKKGTIVTYSLIYLFFNSEINLYIKKIMFTVQSAFLDDQLLEDSKCSEEGKRNFLTK